MTKNNPIIECENLSFQYDAQSAPTLHDVNLSIYQGEKVLIVGQSGSGKSTLAHILNGLIPHYYQGKVRGKVTVCGMNPTTTPLKVLAEKVGTVLQDSDGQFIGLTVAEDIAFCLENKSTSIQVMREKVLEAARSVSIEHKLDAKPQDLSGGQKQRVTMAGVLVEDVDVLLFDEPLASLDPASGRQTIELIDKLHTEHKKTVIIIEHRLEDVLYKNVDRIILFSGGRIIANGSPDEIIASNVLTEHGIREPLYIGALHLANEELPENKRQVILSSDKPAHINTFKVKDEIVEVFKNWATQPPQEITPERSILEVENLSFDIDGNYILKDISFKISQGEMLAICGSNGAGKSTLAKLICGFEKLTTGVIKLRDKDITNSPIARRGKKIGFVIQNPNQMISKVMIKDEINLGLQGMGLTDEEREERIAKALRICGLNRFKKWPVNALSYGQKKRVTIASIMAIQPEVVILDEPTAGQDWAHYTEIMDFLKSLNEIGTTIILITHDMHLALEYTNRAIVMSNGRIVADDTPANILTNETITKQADLVTTSLYDFAKEHSIEPANNFIDNFIQRDKVWREKVLKNKI
ncbi:ABC transporter ATP-binding protein [Actinomyces sp. zg-332]|uniref:ABC transporter ATP-binding protein n=1 Tax=Actinomyces sp. zg-332 TaxID=2708340 RepID=UPI0014204563|nr:ABC transporter ATP-binding protein [Actinomyces sp. zg-332]QPK93945.1 ABC transporter ATP-binding protein [Actinomyces sp. zg-332]